MADGEEHAWWKPYYRQIEPALTFTVPRKVKIVDARLVSIPPTCLVSIGSRFRLGRR